MGLREDVEKNEAIAKREPVDPLDRTYVHPTFSPETRRKMYDYERREEEIRDRPLQAYREGSHAIDRAAAQQAGYAGLEGSQAASIRNQGTGLGTEIVGKYAEKGAEEAVARNERVMKVKELNMVLSQGQASAAMADWIKRFYAKQGIDLSRSNAIKQAASTALGLTAQFGAAYAKSRTPEDNSTMPTAPDERQG